MIYIFFREKHAYMVADQSCLSGLCLGCSDGISHVSELYMLALNHHIFLITGVFALENPSSKGLEL